MFDQRGHLRTRKDIVKTREEADERLRYRSGERQEQSASIGACQARSRAVPLVLRLATMSVTLRPEDYPLGPRPDWELEARLGRLKSVLDRYAVRLIFTAAADSFEAAYYLRRYTNVCI